MTRHAASVIGTGGSAVSSAAADAAGEVWGVRFLSARPIAASLAEDNPPSSPAPAPVPSSLLSTLDGGGGGGAELVG
eukprot:CAMPEP_0197612866 /NCGR_PEP_ID=MMETSP1326-20131121/58119_1 /TAXON_ID=1155430 /ORGANISM="Genus nov. species nov., Strain RCC2288" /LENGTH=76 /DNA_ID=CAMNT_0043181675 /DNA_START=200 /DNA_END=426 /DNA_ORIENTATION=-